MRHADFVQMDVGLLHRCGDPGAVRIAARACAALDHVAEGAVERHLEIALTHPLAQAARDMQLIRIEHCARIRRPPQQRLAVLIPGEAAMSIGRQQPIGAQIASGRQKTVGFM